MPILNATNIHKAYHPADQAPTVVLRGADLAVEPSEFLAVVGPSGAGKSTLLHILATLDAPDQGNVWYEVGGSRVDATTLDPTALAALRNGTVGMVFQFHHLLPEFTALENVMMPVLVAGSSWSVARDKAASLMKRVGLKDRAEHMPTELSGGEQQRVAIARALVNDPKILFADEPTGNLDTANADIVSELLEELQRDLGITCVIATHSKDLASRAHRIVQMQDGRCLDAGKGLA